MMEVNIRLVIFILIALFFIYRLIGKPIIGIIFLFNDLLSLNSAKKKNASIIIKLPEQKKIKINYAEIIASIIILVVFITFYRSLYALGVCIGLLTVFFRLALPRIYKNINGLYREYIILDKIIKYENVHSWKRIDIIKTISFLQNNGIRFDIFMGNEFNKSIDFLNSMNVKEEI